MADATKKKKLGFPLGVDENMFYNPIIEGDKIEETPIIPNSELFYSGIKTNTGDYTVDDFVQGAINNSREKNRVVGADGKEYTFDELDDLGISSIDAFFQGYSNNMYGKKAIKKGFELPSPNPLSYQPTIGDKVVYAGADEEGNPILKLVDGNEEDIKKVDGIVFDIYGPKPTSRSFTSAFYANVRNALSPVSIGSQLSSFLELTTDIGEMSKNYLDPNIRRFESEEGTTDDIAEYFSNKKRIDLTSPTLEESEHPWSSAAGISGNLGNAAASMVLYGGYGRALSVFKSPNFSMWGAGLILNTGEAYESAKQSGLDEEDAAMLSLSVGFINTALEQKFGANLVNRWLSGGGSREISKIVLDETKGVLDKATLNAVSNTVYNRVLTGIKNFTEKQIIGSASEEFFEEGMQTLIGKTAEVLYDRAVEGSDKKTFGTRFDKDTWAEIFGSAAIGAIMGGVGGAFVPKGKEANIYDYVIKGKTDQVFAVLDQMKLKGDITPEQFDSYTERLNMLSDLWGKNSTVFKEIKEAKNDKINTAAFSHIDGIFHAKNKLENIDAQIEAVRNDNSLVDVVKEEKIAELELKKINIKDEIQFRESYLKNFIKDSNGKVAVLDNPKIASTKYTNEQFTKFILDKENQSHEETLRAAIAEQQVLDLIPEDQLTDEQKEDKETLDGLIKHTQELIDEKNKIIQSIDDNRVAEEELEAQELQNKKAEEKQEILEQKKEDSETPVEKIDDKPVLGYVQKVQPNGLLESIEEYPFVAKTFNQTTGRNEYDIVLPDGSIERVDNPTFVETDGSSGTQSSGKVVLNGVDHFSNPLFWNYYREVEMLKNISAAEGISEAELLEAYGQEGFPAHYQRALLEHILATRPNWRDYIKLEAVENKQSPEYLAKPVDLKNKRIRGKRYSGVNITLSITNPETGEVYRLAHTLDTDFFEEVIDERTVVPIDFLKLDYNEFNSKFAFRSFGEKNERNATPEEYEKFLLVYESAMTFNKWVNKWYSDNNYKDIVPIPEEAYSLEPYGMLDFKHKLDPEVAIADIPVLENAPIIAPFQSTLKTINGLPLPSGLDFNLEITSGAYYALAQFPNGYNTWVRLNGKTIEHDKELEKELSELIKNANNFASNFDSTTALNTLVEFEGSEVELKQAFKTLSDRLGFIQSNDPRISVNWSIDVPMASEGALPNYQVKLEFKFTEEGKSIKGSSLYITDFESISDLLSQIKEHEKKNAFLINKARVLYSIDKSSFKSWPAYGDLGLNYKKKLYPITKPNIIKSWNVKIRFNGEALMKEVPLAVSNYTPSDIDESVPSEFSGTEIEDFIKEQETSIEANIERSFKVDDLNVEIKNIGNTNFTYNEKTKTLTINSDIKGKLAQGYLQDILNHELFHHAFKKLTKEQKEELVKFALNSWNKLIQSNKPYDRRFIEFMLDNYTKDRSAADIQTFYFLEEYLGNNIASEYNSSEKETVLNNPIIKSIIKESEFLKKEINAKYDAEVSNQSKIETQIADIEIGKVGNTEYEVKVDGVYYQGKKLDNSENKTYRQLIEADIERRRREELNNIKSKAEIEKYFANKFKNEFPNGVNESGIISIQEVLEKLLNEDEHKLIEQYRYSNILKDKINAKYDAEVADLENKKSEQNKLSKFKKEDLDKYDNIDFKIVDRGTINYTLTLEDARDWVAKRFGKSAFVQNIDTLIHNSEITGIPVGAVVNNIMYLRKIGDKTDMYHEAGHIVFNNFLTFKRQNAYIERIKNELKWSPKQLEEAKQKLRARSSRYRNMSDAALERKVYEEEIMDKYADWQTKREETRTWLSDFFNSLKSFVDWLFNNQSLVALFNQIDRGAFRNAKAKNKYGEIDFKIVPGFNPVTSNVFKSQLVGFMINAKLPATLSGFEKAYDMLLSTYDVDNSDVQKFIKNSTIEDLETKMAVVWSRLSKAEAKNVLMNEVIKFFKKNKYNPEVEVYDDSSSEEGDRVYDKPANEIDPTDTINEVVRNFLATTLAIDKDIFGRPVETVIPWQTVYNRLLPVLSVTHTKSSDIIRRLSYMSKDSNDTFIQAVYERLIKETGYSKETPDGVGTEGKNLLIAFKNAFALEQNLYLQAVLDNGQASIHIENKKDLGQKTKEEWEDDHIKNYLNKVNADKQIASKVNKDFEHLLLRLSSNPADVELSKFKNYRPENAVLEVLNSVGIKLQKKHAQAAFGEETDDVEERRIVNENKQPIITISDIKLISEYLKKGQPLFSGEEGVDTLASQIKLIATADARYNPFIVAKTYQDAAGKKRYSYSEANMMHSEIHKLRTDVYNESRYNDLLNRQNGYFKYNSLVNKSYQDAKNILNNLWPHLIYDLSVRDENQTEGITSKSATDGDFLVLMHMYYQRTIKNSETGNKPFAIFSMSQISDKTSQYGFFLPVDRYVTNGKLNELGKKDLWNMFKTDLFTKQEKFNTGYIFKGDLFFFDYLKSDINVGDYVKALISKETSIEDVTPEVENMIVKAIYDKLIQQANDHIKILQDMGLYDNVVTPALKKEYPNILDYFVNHQLNTFIKVNDAYKLIGGSPNYTKGWDDFIKRMGRIIAAGRDFSAGKSTTYHKVAFTDDQVVFVNPENFDETTTDSKKAKELGWDEINTTDAQVWSTTNSKLEDMRKLGLLTDALESVLLRMSVVKDNDGNLVFPNPDDVPTRDEIEAAGLDLIPSKQVTGGKTDDLKEVYNKMAVHYLSFVDLAYHDGEKWIPRPDRLSLYNKYMMMVNNDVTHLVPKSAAKMFYGSPVSHSFLNDYTGQTVNTYIVPDIYRRLQVQNSTKSKKNIVLSNQILNIIGSELPDTEENNRLKTRMQQSIARMKSQDLNFLDRILVGSDGKRPDLTVLLNTLMSIAEDSSGDSQMLEMLSHTNGKPNYDTNVAHISSKFTEMFFSRYKDVFRQKGFGRILTAVSSDGYNVIEDKNTGEIITDYTEYNSDKHKIRPLRGMRNSESGITPAEIFIPRKYAELYNLQVGQELTSDLFKTILYRVPSQSYHSAAIAKVVGFLPDYYGDTIVAPKEFVLLMGMDFDVDKLYMYSKAFYQNKKGEIIVYGKEKTLEQRFESYLKDLTENNPYIKAEYKRRLESDSSFAEVKEELKNARKKLNSIFEAKKELRIHKGVLQRLNRTMQDILGDDNSELDQESLSENILFIKQDIAELRNIVSNIPDIKEEIFDLMDSIVQRQEFELVQTLKYFNMPVNMEEFSKSSYIPKYQLWNDVVDSMYEIFNKSDLWDAFRMKLSTDRTDSFIETNKNKLSTADIVPGTPNAVYSSFKNARQGKVQTGIAVTNNTSIQFLLENNIVIDPEIIQETPIILNNEIIRQFNIDDLNRESMDAGSEILGRIVDNQKNPVADKLNLTPETMGIAYIITKATGDLDLALLFLQSPTLKAISEAKKNSERVVNPVDYFGETTKILKNLDNKEIELKKKSPSLVVNYIPVTKQNLEWLINNLNYETLSDDDKAKYIGLEKEIYRNYSILKDIAGTTQAITTALSLNRSIDSDIASAYRVLNAFDTVEKNKVLPNAYGALMSNPVNQVNHDILKHALRTLSLYQITETYYANDVIDTVLGMLSSSGRKKYHQDIINSFMSSLQMAVIEKNEGSLLKHAELLMKNPKSLANIVSEFKSRKEYENNVFLKLLSTKMNLKEEAYDLVTADSRSKLSPEAQAAILDASTYIMHKEPELFRKLEKYLQLMDGMMFRNGSFVKMMPAETFKSVAKALEDINEVLTGNYNNEQRIAKFKELTGYDFNEFKNRFIDQFFMHIVNKRLPRTDYKGYNKEGKTIFNKTFINGILKINLVDKTNPETDIQVFKPVYNEDETLLKIDFPRYLRVKLETTGYKGYRLKKVTDFSAEYEPIIYIGDKRRKPYSLSIADNIKLQQMLKQDIKQNTPDTVEESTNLISDDNSVFFEQESVGDIASQIPVDESTYIPTFGKAVAKPEVQNLWSQYQQASIENNKTVDLTQAEFEALSTEEQETIIYQIKNCK